MKKSLGSGWPCVEAGEGVQDSRGRNLMASLGYVALLLAAASAEIACDRRSQAERKERETTAARTSAEEEESRRLIREMAARHNAVTDWHASLPQEPFARTYTALIDRAWVRKDSRPILVMGSISDITRRHDSYRVYLSVSLGPLAERGIDLSLDATETQVEPALRTPGSVVAATMELFAVVARISSVGSGRDHIETESDEDGEHTRAEISATTRAAGVLLEMIRIPGVHPFGEFPLSPK